MIKKIKKFMHFRWNEKILLIKVVALTAVFRFAMLAIPFRYLSKYMGDLREESSNVVSEEQYREAGRIAWAISKVAKYTPWQSKCLVQALTAQFLLYHKGIESTLYLGVTKDKSDNNLLAHSWIRCGEFFVTGGNGENFTKVARFKKGII